jgi:hypothetical protein
MITQLFREPPDIRQKNSPIDINVRRQEKPGCLSRGTIRLEDECSSFPRRMAGGKNQDMIGAVE